MLAAAALSAVALAGAWPAPVRAQSGPGSVESFVDTEFPGSGAPGLAYALVADGEVTSVGARGVVERGRDEAVTPDTPFVTGSISKSFTALSVMQLVEAGKVDLDARLSRYLDVFADRPAGAITVRQLLSHTSGYSTVQGNASHADVTPGQDELARRVDHLADVAPANPPDEQWEYSNTNYEILGRLVEVVSGREYQAYVAEAILEPVGMANSFVADGEIHEAMATGHTPWFGTKRPLPGNRTSRGSAPQGGVVASANDLARYLRMMMNGQDDVLSAGGKSLMMRPASAMSPFYGLGWRVDPGTGAVWHDGVSPGVETLASMLPTEKTAAVVLVNGGSGFGFGETGHLRSGIAARALGLDDDNGSAWSRQAFFLSLVVMPITYLLSMAWAWRRRSQIRAKVTGGFSGLFSLWFPLLTTLVAAWVLVGLVPSLFGTPLGTLRLFAPDLVVVLVASAVTGVLWAAFRLWVAYADRIRRPSRQAAPIGDDRTVP
ncbi:serine hydrolase [uncultured Phycicoccus sp.]|uniref:serine hydrolase domain-containing protein n=1 Tax=uncultured Phycicoccus sp. TaxID=661422 RepID=UPI00260F9F48|nr:serine hydrolase domain-containing protein [uncultured Phycicoccus sp.]